MVTVCEQCLSALKQDSVDPTYVIFLQICKTWLQENRGSYYFENDIVMLYLEERGYIITTDCGKENETGKDFACAKPHTVMARDSYTHERGLWICRGQLYHE
jgi:hypothetical protein